MASVSGFLEILGRPTIGEVMFESLMFVAPTCAAVIIGIVVGWLWKPNWAKLKINFVDSAVNKAELKNSRIGSEDSISSSVSDDVCSSLKSENEIASLVNVDDLKKLHTLVEEKDGGPPWIKMMDRSTATMSYQAWRRDPENGPPQYRSRTIYEDATPEMLRDFFWDDEFRSKWDDMLIHAETLEECPATGTMVVKWVRKFPFFCSDREYIIGRRIWKCGQTYYCVTKGVPCSSVPRRDKPRRVDLCYSSWFIRAAESKRDGRRTACEVLLFHHEDMGIPWEIAKFGIRQGMWGAVKKIDPGLRLYQKQRGSSDGPPLSQINTEVKLEYLERSNGEIAAQVSVVKPSDRSIPRILLVGGIVALACTVDRGLLTKAAIFGVARRFARKAQL